MLATSIIPTHSAAEWLLGAIDRVLDLVGLSKSPTVEEIIYLAVILGVALALGWLVRVGIVWIVRKVMRLRQGFVGQELLRRHIIRKCSHFIPPLVFLALVPFAVVHDGKFITIIEKIATVYAIVAFTYGLCAVLSFIFDLINERRNERHLPVRGILNVIVGILWIITAIIAVSIFVDKSPATLLAGLGAFAAALMLIFKDSILGFVAGIQMSENDMVRVGDWIVVPGTLANGTVMDVSLSTVKIQNFDNTMVMVPPYTLVSQGFQNYRYMSDTGARRIVEDFVIDFSSVAPLTSGLLNRLAAKYPAIKQFADKAAAQPDSWVCNNGNYVVNGTTETNLGLFRAYLTSYLIGNPRISQDQMILVREMDPTTSGYTLQLYCFTATSAWVEFEAIRSAMIEHVATVMSDFGLNLYNAGSYDIALTGPGSSSTPADPAAPAAK
ncbi:MAG: mechanosensitive ion channel family protein [Muribaculaceae bacterium]|nr:mechanosensitive ion channel family protein [Muribaculaceae bacterium]